MGSIVRIIDCPKCGNTHGYEDDDLRDKVLTIGCDECGYKKVINYVNSNTT